MRASILRDFAGEKPRAIVLDDSANARRMTAYRLRKRGFDTVECSNAADFLSKWIPGTADVIIADWGLSNDPSEHGDRVLELVRARDWDVPFVLVSGRLDQDSQRVDVLQTLLNSGSARFVRRGNNGIKRACESAEDLIERRDLALVRIILGLRQGALRGEKIQTSSGERAVRDLLEEIVSAPRVSHDAGRPVAKTRSGRAIAKESS